MTYSDEATLVRTTRCIQLHYRRYRNTHDGESANQFTADDGDRGQQELLSHLIRLREDGIAVVERIEELRELKSMLGEVGWFGSRDALINYVRSLGRCEPELPDLVGAFTA